MRREKDGGPSQICLQRWLNSLPIYSSLYCPLNNFLLPFPFHSYSFLELSHSTIAMPKLIAKSSLYLHLYLYLYLYIKLEVDFDLVNLKIYNEFCDNSRCRNLTLATGLELRAIHLTNTVLTLGSKGGPWRYYPQPPLAGFNHRIKL